MISAHDPLRGSRVVVLGFGRQGQALARWLPTIGAKTLVVDQKTIEQLRLNPAQYPDVEFVLGGYDTARLDGADVLCISGGAPLDQPIVTEAMARGIRITNDAQLFLERCPAPVLGITGSAGKTTTTTLTGELMRAAGFRTWVGGNIGDVLLNDLASMRPSDRVVMELSSFQLELMTASPDYACITNITPNHLDRHGTMEAYIRAKANILLHQSDPLHNVVVLGRDDANASALAGDVYTQLIWFSMREMVPDGAFMAGQRLVLAGLSSSDRKPHIIGDRGDVHLPGDHNLLNVLAACALTGAAGVKPDTMIDTIRNFRGVPHRLEIVRERRGVTFVNDSIATAPERVIAALHSFDEPIILLLGGRDKKLPWQELMRLASHKARRIYAFGEAADLVASVAREVRAPKRLVVRVDTLEQAVQKAARAARSGDVVLLSPGGTSYDAYVDFAARGEHFRSLVAAL
jgi:UDP-N-acetylmuramoylalanine--D-glutamate ligase